jgi:hypothetical protein
MLICECVVINMPQTHSTQTAAASSVMREVPYWYVYTDPCQRSNRARDRNEMSLDRIQQASIYKLHGLSPRANYTDRATAACRQS